MKKSANNIDVKKFNRNRIFKFINSKDQTSKPEIASSLGLSIPTIMQIVNELVSVGLITEVGEYASTGGRKAIAIASVKDKYFSVGLDITKNHIALVLTNLSGDIIKHERIYYPYRDENSYYKELSTYTEKFISDYSSDNRICLGVGISVPGIVDTNHAKIKYSHALNILNLDFIKFTQYFKYKCNFVNDANAAAIAEIYHSFNIKDIVYLSLSNSVGGAIVKAKKDDYNQENIDNLIYMGNNGRSGEFGHMTLIPNGIPCYCGKVGCADSYISASSLSKYTDNMLELFFEKVELEDIKICKLWDDYLEFLSILINNVRMIFDCDIVLGGYVGSYIEPYIGKVIEKTKIRNTFEADGTYIQACRYKYEASALGAALVLMDSFISTI